MPLSSRVARPDGGKSAGILTTVVSIPWASSALPEGFSLPQQLHAPRRQRQLPSSQRHEVARRHGPRRRQVRRHGLRVAMDEVEDAMTAGVEAGDERGPGDRALRGNRCPERAESAACRDLRKMREAALRHQVASEGEVETVESKHDDASAERAMVCAASSDRIQQQSGETDDGGQNSPPSRHARPASGRPSM